MTNKKRPAHLPDFKKPPVAEVVLGVQFNSIPDFKSIHLGKLHEAFKSEYPKFTEMPAISPSFETFGTQSMSAGVSFSIRSGPELPRVWFVEDDEHCLVQFQPDRLLVNWRKLGDDEDYPRYERLERRFKTAYVKLCEFLNDQKLSEPTINQCEVSYINFIYAPDNVQINSQPGLFLKCWEQSCDGLSGSEIESVNLTIRKLLLDSKGGPYARLLIESTPQFSDDGKQRARLTLSAKGSPFDTSLEDALDFFRQGRDEIVTMFAKVTREDMHKVWGRIQ